MQWTKNKSNGTLHFLFNRCSNRILDHAFVQSFLDMCPAENNECPRKEPGYSFMTRASCFAGLCGHLMLKIIPWIPVSRSKVLSWFAIESFFLTNCAFKERKFYCSDLMSIVKSIQPCPFKTFLQPFSHSHYPFWMACLPVRLPCIQLFVRIPQGMFSGERSHLYWIVHFN